MIEAPEKPVPSHRCRPADRPEVSGLGGTCTKLATALGVTLDEWQADVLTDWLALADDDQWCATTEGLSVPRQNGKNLVSEIYEVFMLVNGYTVIHTAHQNRTAAGHFERMLYWFGRKVNDPDAAFPELNALVVNVQRSFGREEITLRIDGQEVKFRAATRSDGAGRGFTADVLVCDEAQHMEDKELAALKSVLSAGRKRNPKTIFMGTPPPPSVSGEVFRRIRHEAVKGETGGVGWTEFSPADDAPLSSPSVWWSCNPAMHSGRMTIRAVEDEHATLSLADFARERLGRWNAVNGAEPIIPEVVWGKAKVSAADVKPDKRAGIVLGVAVGDAGQFASVVAVQAIEDDRVLVQHMRTDEGLDWVPGYLEILAEDNTVHSIVLDDFRAGALLVEPLRAAHVRFRPLPQGMEIGKATALFFNGVKDGRVVHTGQRELTAALFVARKRTLGQSGLWTWVESEPGAKITPLVAATLALWGAGQPARNPAGTAGRARPRVNSGRAGRAEPRRSRLTPRELEVQRQADNLAVLEERARRNLGSRADDPEAFKTEVQRLTALAGGL